MSRRAILSGILALTAGTLQFTGSSAGQQGGKPASASTSGSATGSVRAAAANQPDDEGMRTEGEKRFHANCGRCH
jgi:mono/diheme cytochrome c family protein